MTKISYIKTSCILSILLIITHGFFCDVSIANDTSIANDVSIPKTVSIANPKPSLARCELCIIDDDNPPFYTENVCPDEIAVPCPRLSFFDKTYHIYERAKLKFEDCISVCPAVERLYRFIPAMFSDSICDYSIHYGKENLLLTGGTLLVGGILANTRMDREVHRTVQNRIRSRGSNGFFKPFESIGKFMYLRIYIWTLVLGNLLNFQQSPVGDTIFEWAYRSFRSMLLVSPQITFLRHILGGGRYGARHYKDSRWRFLKKGRASCSGHTFNGALPLLTASVMSEDPIFRYGFFALSFLPAISRINDDQHYLSQVMMGWVLAYLSVRTVDIGIREKFDNALNIRFIPMKDGAMVQANYQF